MITRTSPFLPSFATLDVPFQYDIKGREEVVMVQWIRPQTLNREVPSQICWQRQGLP